MMLITMSMINTMMRTTVRGDVHRVDAAGGAKRTKREDTAVGADKRQHTVMRTDKKVAAWQADGRLGRGKIAAPGDGGQGLCRQGGQGRGGGRGREFFCCRNVFSSHIIPSISRWFVGSSRIRISGFESISFIRETTVF